MNFLPDFDRSCLSKRKELRVFPSQDVKLRFERVSKEMARISREKEREDGSHEKGDDLYFLFGQITARRGNEDDEKWAKSTSRVINVAISVLRCRV